MRACIIRCPISVVIEKEAVPTFFVKKKIIISKRSLPLFNEERGFLDRETISLLVVPSKEEALALHRNDSTNLIIIDLDEPHMSAEEFCSLVREDRETRNVSIVVLCSEEAYKGIETGTYSANAVISHPVEAPILFEKVRELLNIRERAFFRSTLGIKVQGSHNNKPFICFSENISASGILVESEKILNLGEKIMCGFYLPDSTHVVSEAEIIRVVEKKNDYDTLKYGIRFISLKDNLAEAIDRFVNRNRKGK